MSAQVALALLALRAKVEAASGWMFVALYTNLDLNHEQNHP
jgi:hypothetical protein